MPPQNGSETDLIAVQDNSLGVIGQVANTHAAHSVFADYLSRKADNTIHRQAADLARFAEFLNQVGQTVDLPLGAALSAFAQAVRMFPNDIDLEASAWQGITWRLVEGFRNWIVGQGDAVGSINVRLSTVKAYARLAAKAGVLTAEELALIRSVEGYAHKEARCIDERRKVTRRGAKKSAAVRITEKQARQLKTQPDTPQGRRNALLMCLLLRLP